VIKGGGGGVGGGGGHLRNGERENKMKDVDLHHLRTRSIAVGCRKASQLSPALPADHNRIR